MRRPGIEPGSSAWEAEIIPIDHRRKLSRAQTKSATIPTQIKHFYTFANSLKYDKNILHHDCN